ncbi:hypothetical protein BME96_12575 [Virgibacillus halodenitrificans]|uniref:Uncharacterized protein n=1 Tax=Virgibacillus halodenitrificans TaxID=1482 RepID=A0AAC9J152_VIRHA|nr:hypothetical protein [Virgibacillus halodenitrificans]APC48975.1 hypothetical protein BME96_12575 [Virgibacillus halodenitrificans]
MTNKSKLRGHEIEFTNGIWIYSDTKEPTVNNERDCGHCGLSNTTEGHDGCLGALRGVMNACCGHGNINEAYVQFDDGVIVRKMNAMRAIDKLLDGE